MKLFGFEIKTKNRFLLFIGEIVDRYNENRISYTSGSMAYFFTLSLFPFIMFLNSLLGLLRLDTASVTGLLSPLFPKEIINIITTYTTYVSGVSSSYILIFSIIISLYSSSRAANAMMITINSVYAIKKRRHFIHEFLLSAAFTAAIGIVLFLFSAAVIAGGKVFEKIYIALNLSNISVAFMSIAIILAALVLIFFIVLFLYYFMPNKKMKLRRLIWGSIFATLSISLIGVGISVYLSLSTRFSLLYGSISAIIIVMLWFYLFANIISIGAEINRILEIRKDGNIPAL